MHGAVHAGESVRPLKIPVSCICSAALLAVEALAPDHQALWQHSFCIPAGHLIQAQSMLASKLSHLLLSLYQTFEWGLSSKASQNADSVQGEDSGGYLALLPVDGPLF